MSFFISTEKTNVYQCLKLNSVQTYVLLVIHKTISF